jgi:hypothetical protein
MIRTVILDKKDVYFCHKKQGVGWNKTKIALHSNMENYQKARLLQSAILELIGFNDQKPWQTLSNRR